MSSILYFVCVCVCAQSHSHVQLFVAHQTPLSMGFSSKNTRVGCHFLLQGIFLSHGLNHIFCVSCIAGRFFTAESLYIEAYRNKDLSGLMK